MGLEVEVKKSVNDIDLNEEIKMELEKELPTVARTLSQFQNMLHAAKMTGKKEMEASIDIHKFFQKEKYKAGVGYMMFENVIVWEEGQKEMAQKRDSLTSEQKTFKDSKITIDNMGMGHKK